MERSKEKVQTFCVCTEVVGIRCRNYPTAENLARKQQLATKKSERGELAVTPLHRCVCACVHACVCVVLTAY